MKTLRKQMMEIMQVMHYSEKTIENYILSLSLLSRYYGKSPDKISIKEIKSYLHDYIHNKGYSRSFVNQLISAYRFLQVYVLENNFNSIGLPRVRPKKSLPTVLSKEEIKRLLSVTNNLKHRVILELGYSAGLRVNELLHLQINHIDSKRMQIKVENGKGNKDRYTILSPSVLEKLRVYYQHYHPFKYLIESTTPGLMYSASSIRKVIKLSTQKAGITKNVTFHTLRHSFATHLLEQGVNLKHIQQLMGHSSLHSTSVYLHVSGISNAGFKSPIDC